VGLAAVLGVLAASLCFILAVFVEWATTGLRHDPAVVVPDRNQPQIATYAPHSRPRTENGATMEVNNYGLRRDADIAPHPSPRQTRIAAYGDSITRGFGLAYRQTWAAKLEDALARPNTPPQEVLIMLRGTSPSIYAVHLRHDLPALAPTTVLVEIELLNDLSDEALLDYERVGDDGLPAMLRGGRYLTSWDGSKLIHSPVLGPWLEGSRVMEAAGSLAGLALNHLEPNPLFDRNSASYIYSIGPERSLLTPARLDAAFTRMFNTISRMRELSESRDATFVLLIMPSQYVFEPGRYHESALAWLRRAEVEAGRRGLHWISPVDAFAESGGASLFVDFCHPNARGADVLAAQLHREFESR
jgi:hypothetical protein